MMNNILCEEIALAKTRIYRFDQDLRNHVLIEEIERQCLRASGIPAAAKEFLGRWLDAWRMGAPTPGFCTEAAKAIGLDIDEALPARLHWGSAGGGPEINGIICIVGSPRSGTSFLFHLFARMHAMAYFNSVSHHLWSLHNLEQERRPFLHQGDPGLLWIDTRRLRLRLDVITPSEAEGILNRSIHVYDHLQRHEYRLCEAHIVNAEMLRRCIDSHIRFFNASHFVCKSPFSSFRMKQIHQLFPKSKFIHITRNGYDASESIRRNGFKYIHPSCVSVSAESNWAMHVNSVLSHLGNLDIYQIKYEDLMEDCSSVFNRLLEWVGVEDRLSLSPSDSTFTIRPPATINRRHDIIEALNSRLGYP